MEGAGQLGGYNGVALESSSVVVLAPRHEKQGTHVMAVKAMGSRESNCQPSTGQ